MTDNRIARADRLFSMIVRQRDKGCRRCGAPMNYEDLQTHHLVKRRYRKTRWLLEAAVALDYLCHEYLEKHPAEAESFAISILGTERWNELNAFARDTSSKVDLDEVLADLRARAAA